MPPFDESERGPGLPFTAQCEIPLAQLQTGRFWLHHRPHGYQMNLPTIGPTPTQGLSYSFYV